MTNNQTIIEAAFEDRSNITPDNVSADIKDAVNQTIDGLNDGLPKGSIKNKRFTKLGNTPMD